MTHTRLVLSAGLLLSFAGAAPATAQITTLSRTAIAAPDSTIDKLTKRIEALESTVAALQQKIAFIKSASPLVLDAGADAVTIRAAQVSFDVGGALSMRAGTTVALTSGTDMNLRSTSNASLRAGNQMLVEAASVLDLKGASIHHNGGSVPIACAASVVNGQTVAVPGLSVHAHPVVLPVSPCSGSVGVPGPGQ